MINRWQGRFSLVDTLTEIQPLETEIPDLALAIVDVKGKQGYPNGFHLLQHYTHDSDDAVINGQHLTEHLNLRVPRLVDSPAKDASDVALLTALSGVNWMQVKPLTALLSNEQTSPRILRTIMQRIADMMTGWNDARDLGRNRTAVPLDIALSSEEASNFIVGHQLLRNPFADLWSPQNIRIYQFPGLCFGGIKTSNIYCDGEQPLLLDVRGVVVSRHMLMDWASLEISLLLSLCPLESDKDWTAWLSLCQTLSDSLVPVPHDLPPGRVSLALELITSLRQAIQVYVNSLSSLQPLFEQSFWATLLQTSMHKALHSINVPAERIALKAYAALLFAKLSQSWSVNWVSHGTVETLQLPQKQSIGEEQAYTRGSAAQRAEPDEIQPIKARWALLVGINQYAEPQYSPLQYCVDDVQMLTDTLDQAGYTTITLQDKAQGRLFPTTDNVIAEIIRLRDEIDAQDLLWLHFSCHGDIDKDNNRQVLITQDYRVQRSSKALTVNHILDVLKEKKMRRVILTLDACHAGVEGWRGSTQDALFISIRQV